MSEISIPSSQQKCNQIEAPYKGWQNEYLRCINAVGNRQVLRREEVEMDIKKKFNGTSVLAPPLTIVSVFLCKKKLAGNF